MLNLDKLVQSINAEVAEQTQPMLDRLDTIIALLQELVDKE